ncbi:hypothetical protein SAMN05216223_102182 [Actinacidiphila yanglinensis]|uniref:Uncharacterized protein n=1 Tax=Actinacidiphila yanglinensis TaxID=310779 RepID=A0A1H5V7J3_9ACTN|nr:hypothetical protein [Actinacidiphila yanglinensis]SEF83190.1 hypothetical protein SAMN05216223_102182 [Actinacidiphila yanglinensis]
MPTPSTPPASPAPAPSAAAELSALVEEATKKSGLVWVNGQAVWHLWLDGGLHLVCGPGEQPVPGLTDGGTATVTVRSKDKGGRLVTWTARVEVLAPHGEPWEAAVGELKGKRLNAVDAEAVPSRWAADCQVFRLAPAGPVPEHPGAMPDGSGAAAPVPTPATTRQAAPAGLPKLLARRRRT